MQGNDLSFCSRTKGGAVFVPCEQNQKNQIRKKKTNVERLGWRGYNRGKGTPNNLYFFYFFFGLIQKAEGIIKLLKATMKALY